MVSEVEDARRLGAPGEGVRPIGEHPTVAQRLRYAFDNTMARGTPALIGWLGVATLALIAVFTAVVLIGDLAPDDSRSGIVGQAFESLLHALDPGTIAEDDGKWPFLVVMLLVTLGGLFVVSALIGVIATGLDRRIQEMRKGRSAVLERDHTLILGWSDTVFTVLAELEIANQSRKRPSVVVLADRDKVEMDDLIRERVGPSWLPGRKRTRVITRSGSPIDLGHLALVRPEKARSIVVLSPEGEPDPDAQVIKTVLALTKGREDRGREYPIVAEIQDPANLAAARLVAGKDTVLIDKRETIARLVVHAARQSGASLAIVELLDFDGDEIYFGAPGGLTGRPFTEAVLGFERCSPIGLLDAERNVLLNPPGDRLIGADEQLIAIAADEVALKQAAPAAAGAEEDAVVTSPPSPRRPENILLLGWNDGASAVIREFDEFLLEGSIILLLTDEPAARECVERDCADLRNAAIELRPGTPTDPATLASLVLEELDRVVVLSQQGLDAQRADARTLVTLLHLRDLADRRGARFSIVSEMIDERNRRLAEVTRVDDVIVSDKIVSLMLTQISESHELAKVFEALFSAGGGEIYLRPAADYIATERETVYATVAEAARRRGECAIGFRRAALAEDAAQGFGVRINPPKSERLSFVEEDRVIVLA